MPRLSSKTTNTQPHNNFLGSRPNQTHFIRVLLGQTGSAHHPREALLSLVSTRKMHKLGHARNYPQALATRDANSIPNTNGLTNQTSLSRHSSRASLPRLTLSGPSEPPRREQATQQQLPPSRFLTICYYAGCA